MHGHTHAHTHTPHKLRHTYIHKVHIQLYSVTITLITDRRSSVSYLPLPSALLPLSFFIPTDLPANLKSSLFLLLKGEEGLTGTIRKGIVSGGCTCSRLTVVGACLGARDGLEAIPTAWITKTKKAREVMSLMKKLFL